MRHSFIIILFLFFLPNFIFSQDFGCYDIKSFKKNDFDRLHDNAYFGSRLFNKTDWNEFVIDSNISDGHYKKYYFNKNNCSQDVKMEGVIKNGLQEGIWKLKIDETSFYIGQYTNGVKVGLWKGFYINKKGDSTCFSEIEFKNNLYDGIVKYYYPNGKLFKAISYHNGLNNGQEIQYFDNDTTGVKYIEELKEYSNGKLNGKYLIYNYDNPFDTLTSGVYSFGKKNGRFITHYGRNKYIIDFVNDKVEGKFIKYYSNGTLTYELDYKNNLPYNLIQINDTSGNMIECNTLKEGKGKLSVFYDNGALYSSFEYNNQLISGKFFRYYPSGKIMEEGLLYTNNDSSFKKTKPIEHCEDLNLFSAWQLNFTIGTNYTTYNDDGSIMTKIHSEYGDSLGEEIIICDNFKNGKVLSKETLKHGLKNGQVIKYHENDSIEMTGNYKIIDNERDESSVKDGIFKYYYSNGKLWAVIKFSKGKEIGNSYFYDDSGNLKRVKVIEENGEVYNIYDGDTVNCIDVKGRKQGKWIKLPYTNSENECYYIPNQINYFKNDKPIGIWKSYSYNGQILTESLVWKDSLNAYCQRWGYNGKLYEEGYMINQVKNGEWKEYDYKKNYLKYIGQYNCGKREGIWQEFKRNGKMIKKIEYFEGQIKNAL